MGHGFRFALQSAPQDQQQWVAVARRAEQLGYSGLLMPDGLQLPSLIPALALAAGATTSLHVGTYVLASPLRARSLAAAKADIFALAAGPLASRDEVGRLAAAVWKAAGDRASALEFAITIFVVGDEAPAWVQRFSARRGRRHPHRARLAGHPAWQQPGNRR